MILVEAIACRGPWHRATIANLLAGPSLKLIPFFAVVLHVACECASVSLEEQGKRHRSCSTRAGGWKQAWLRCELCMGRRWKLSDKPDKPGKPGQPPEVPQSRTRGVHSGQISPGPATRSHRHAVVGSMSQLTAEG
jgi:hypothetical protein